jgi:hypothetical protein
MTAPTPEPATAKTLRNPLSLRELFCLTTLAAVAVAIVLYREWSTEERWLLALTLGGTLVGILAARICRWRAASVALSLGGLGTVVAVGLTVPKSIQAIQDVRPEYRADVAWEHVCSGVATLVIGVAMVATVAFSFALLRWLMASGAQGFAAQCRRRPIAWGLLGLLVCCGLALAANARTLLHPAQWHSRTRVVPQRDGQAIELGGSELALSRDGRWLGVAVDWYTCNYATGESDQGTWVFALRPEIRQLSLDGLDSHEHYEIAFAPDREWLAYLPTDDQVDELRIWDLANSVPLRSLQRIDEDWFDIDDVDWLPQGRIILTHGEVFGLGVSVWDTTSGERVHKTGEDQRIRVDTRLDHEYVVSREWTRVVDPARQQTITELPSMPFAEQFAPATKVSPNQHFMLGTTGLYDADGKQRIDTDLTETYTPAWHLWTFTGGNHVVASKYKDSPSTWLFDRFTWLDQVPFIARYPSWSDSDQIVLLDPDSGAEVARTQPLWGAIQDITISHDGSVLAAATEHGVYIYDVPAEFR